MGRVPGEAGARQWVLSGRNRNTTAATLLVSSEKEEQVKERGPCGGIPFLERGIPRHYQTPDSERQAFP